MSDEPIRPGEAPVATPVGIWEHYCEHPGCTQWGGHGYQIGKQSARRYCAEHRGEGERLIGRG